MVYGRTKIKLKPRAVIRRPIIIIVVRRRPVGIPIHRRPGGGVHLSILIHVEVDALRNMVLRPKPSAGAKPAGLDKLVGGERQSPDHVVLGAKVVERPVRVAENLQMKRCVAQRLAAGFDPGPRLRSLDEYVVGHRAMGSALRTRRNAFTPGKETCGHQARGQNQSSAHREIPSLSRGQFTTRSLESALEYGTSGFGKKLECGALAPNLRPTHEQPSIFRGQGTRGIRCGATRVPQPTSR